MYIFSNVIHVIFYTYYDDLLAQALALNTLDDETQAQFSVGPILANRQAPQVFQMSMGDNDHPPRYKVILIVQGTLLRPGNLCHFFKVRNRLSISLERIEIAGNIPKGHIDFGVPYGPVLIGKFRVLHPFLTRLRLPRILLLIPIFFLFSEPLETGHKSQS